MSCSQGWFNPARIKNEDVLRIAAQTNIASVRVGVAGVLRNEMGEDSVFSLEMDVSSDRAENVIRQNIGAGVLVHAIAYLASGSVPVGGVYLSARIEREGGATPLPQMALIGGYLHEGATLGFPGLPPRPPFSGHGRIHNFAGADPGAGAEFTTTVPANALWRLMGFRGTLVTAVAVATRQVHLIIDNGTNIITDLPANATQVASLTRNYNAGFFADGPAATDSEIYIPLIQDMLLPAGFRVRTLTTNLQAADDWGAARLFFEEWLTP